MRTAVARKVKTASRKRSGRSAIAASTSSPISLAEAVEGIEPELTRALSEIRKHPRLARVIVTRDLGFGPSTDLLEAFVRIAGIEKRHRARTAPACRMLALWVLARHLSRRLLETAYPIPADLVADENLAADVLAAVEQLETKPPARSRSDRELLLDVASCVTDDLAELGAAVQVSRGLREILERLQSASTSKKKKPTTPAGIENDEIDEIQRVAAKADDEGVVISRTRLNAIALRVRLDSALAGLSGRGAKSSSRAPDDAAVQARAGLEAWPVLATRLREQRDSALAAGLSGFADELRLSRHRLYAIRLQVHRALTGTTARPRAPRRRTR